MSVFSAALSAVQRLQRPALATLLVAGALVVGTAWSPGVVVAAPVCASPPLSGTTTVSGVVNRYFAGLSTSVPAGQANTTVTVGGGVGAATPLADGDLVLIIQMQGAQINATNTDAYGDGVAGGEARGNTSTNFLAGRYEYARVSSVAGSTIGLTGSGANDGLVNSYQNSAATATSGQYRYQVIRVPQYSTAVLNPASPPTAPAWNGSVGGIVVLDAANTLDLNGATIDVTGRGFRPGLQRVRAGTTTGGFLNTDYRTPTSAPLNGQKAEGIAGSPVWQTGDPDSVGDGYPNGDFGRGAPGNAGGGGTDGTPANNGENSGGGGGGNGGLGGRGGNTWNSNLPRGGNGGATITGGVTRLVLGGGGGAGSDNNAVLQSGGGAGGGMVLIRSGDIAGTGTINADGVDGQVSGQDGSGGGGAGGTVAVVTSATGASSGLSGLTINARGGDGGDETHPAQHGPGGGGGGGRVLTSASPAAVDVAGGTNGIHTATSVPYGAFPGTIGTSSTSITSLPGANPGSECIDLSVTKSVSPASVVPGNTVTYTVVATNNGPFPVTGTAPVAVTDVVPAAITGVTWTCSATVGSSCAASGSGSLSTTADLALGGTATYTITGTLSPSFTGTLSNTATVAPPSGVPELDPSDNSDTATSVADPRADLTITKTDGVADATPGTTVTYTIGVSNAGPSAVTAAPVTDALPAGTTAGTWSCAPVSGATCGGVTGAMPLNTTVSLDPGGSATYTVNVDVSPTATGSLVNTASIDVPAGVTELDGSDNMATDTDTLTPTGDLSISKTDGLTTVDAGTPITYTVVAGNTGPSTVTGATVTDTIPAQLTGATWTCVASTGSSCPASGSGDINAAVTLESGATATFTITATVEATAIGTISNTASIAGPSGFDPTPANNSATDTTDITRRADLQITKDDGATSEIPGTSVTYTIVASNPVGPSAITGATVTDTLPTSLSSASWTCVASTGSACPANGSGDINANVDLLVGGTATFTLTANIDSTATGTLDNTVTITEPSGTTDPTPANNSVTDSDTLIPTADLSVTIDDGTLTEIPGTDATYTVVATNAGPSAVTATTIAVPPPASLTALTWTCVASGGAVCPNVSGSGAISELADLPPGGSLTYTVAGDIDPAATGNLTVPASISAPGGVIDPTPANNTDTDVDSLTPTGDLQITKTDGQTDAVPGEAITYTIVISNPTGPSDMVGAAVADTIPSEITGATWACSATGSAACGAASGSGDIATPVDLPVGDAVTFTVSGTVDPGATGTVTNAATVTAASGTADPDGSNNTATDVDNLTPEVDLVIDKDDTQIAAVPGTTVTYTITVSNPTGPSDVVGAPVVDSFPAELASTSWSCAAGPGAACGAASGAGDISTTVDLDVGATVTFTATGTVVSTATGSLTNTATVSAPTGVTETDASDNSDSDIDTLTPVADLSITKTDGQTDAVPGEPITYTIVVTNSGPSTVVDARVTDTLSADLVGATWTCAASSGSTCPTPGTGSIDELITLAPAGTATFTLTATVAPTATGTLANTAAVAMPSGTTDPTPGNNSATDTDNLTPQADLSVTKVNGGTTVVAGTATSYTIEVTNNGPSVVTGATVNDLMPAALESVTWTCSATVDSTCPASGTGDIGATVDLAVNGVATFVVGATVAADATGNVVNTASASVPGTVTDPTPGDNSATDTDSITVSHDLAITKTDFATTEIPGTAVQYTITVSNPTGPSDAVDATVVDALPATLSAASWTCGATSGGNCDAANGSGDINTTVDLPVGATATFVVDATIDATATGTLSNTATVTPASGSSDPTPGDNTATDVDTLDPQADLQVTKTDGQTEAVPGAPTSYTIVVTNAGPSVANGVSVTDALPAGLTGVTWTCTPAGGGSCAAGTGSGDIDTTVDLPVAATATFVVSATIAPDAVIDFGTTLTNTAAVAPPVGVTDPSGPDSATDVTDLTPEADLVITKDDGVTEATPGGSVTYTITASNPTGPSDVVGATVADAFPAAITSATWTCAATGGASCTASGSGDISETVDLPVGGVVTFTVSADIDPAATGVLSNGATVSVPAGVTETDTSDNLATDADTLTPDVDLAISKTNGQSAVVPGDPVSYTIVVTNGGISDVSGATVSDTVPASLTGVSWTCIADAGSSCSGSGSGSINDTVDVAAGESLTYTLTATLDSAASGTVANTASVALPGPLVDPTPGNNTATDSDPITPVADLEITKTDGVTLAAPGTTVTYTIVASNNGPSDVVGATVTDAIPTGVTGFTWTCAGAGGATCANPSGSGAISELVDLPASSSVTFTVDAVISAAATGTLDNTATVAVPTGTTDPGPGPNSATDSDTLGPIADLSVTKDDGSTTATPGGSTTYSIVVTNDGPSPAPLTSVTDAVPAGATAMNWTCTPSAGASCAATTGSGAINTTVDLAPAATATFSVTVAIDPAATGTLDNTVAVAPGPGVNDPDAPADRTATDSDTLEPIADLSITKDDGATISTPGQPITYTIVARNDGPSVVTDATVVDTLPAALTSASWGCVASAGSNCDDPTGLGDISTTVDLLVGGEATFTLSADIDPTALGTLSNTAGISPPSGTTDPDTGDQAATDTNTLAPIADLSITKTDGLTDAAPLDAITYTIVVSNAGDSAVADAQVADTLPAELTGATWTCTNGVGGNCDDATGSGDISTTVDLAPGGSVTIEVAGTLAASSTGTVSNTASVSTPTGVTDPDTSNDDDTDDTAITPTADLSITKDNGQTDAVPGEPLTYTIVVSNAGPSVANGVAISDTVPSSLNSVSWTCATAGGANCDDTSGTGDIATIVDLPSGGSATFTVDATLDASATGTLSNTVTLTPPVGLVDPTTADHTANDTDTITPEADLTITKTHGATDSAPGESITYTIVVGNDGPSNVLDAPVVDTMPADLGSVTWTCVAAGGANCDDSSDSGDISTTVDLPVGGTATFSVTGTIDAAATGTLTNTAGVSAPTGVTETDATDNAATDSNPLTPTADLSITKTDGAMSSVAGTAISYTIVASNPGPSTIVGATVSDTPPPALTGVTWTCVADAGSSCGASSGSGPIADSVTIAVGETVTYTLDATVSAAVTGSVTNTASVGLPVGSIDPTPADNTASDTNTITREADLSITKDDGTTTAVPGATTTYTIAASNAGPSDVVGATVTDALPVGATGMAWTCAAAGGATCAVSGTGAISETVDIPVGGTATFSVTVAVDPSSTGTISNTADIAAPVGVTDPDPGNDTATDVDTLQPEADIVVTNTDGVTSVTPGTTTTYTVTVTNVGPSDAPGTAVAFPVPASGTITGWACADDGASSCADASGVGAIATSADLPAGTSVTYTVTVDIDQTATGTIDTTATGTPAVGITDPTPANNSATDSDTLAPVADLSITKTDGAATSIPGQAISYTIVVSNAGPSAVVAAPVTDTMPPALTSVTWACSATAGSACATATGTGDISTDVDLLAGGSATFVVDATVAPTAAGSLVNTATVDLPAGVTDPDDADRTATDTNTLAPTADLSITKTDGVAAVAPLQPISYTIVVTNAGPSSAIDALVVDTIPAQLTGATWTCTDGTGGTCDTASGAGDVSATVDLAPSGTVTFTIDATVAGSATGTISNTATVNAPAGTTDPDTSDNGATDATSITPTADLSITKTDGQPTAVPGAPLTYTIVVANAGPSSVSNVGVDDTIPAVLTGVTWSCASSGGANCDDAAGTGDIATTVDLPAGDSVTFTVDATLAPTATGTLTNTATLTAPAGVVDPTPADQTATDIDAITPEADLTITKTHGATDSAPGEPITYTIVVGNDGPSVVADASVTDTMPADLDAATWTCVAAAGANCDDASGSGDISTTVDLPVGATATFTVSATVDPAATGTLTNTADVAAPAGVTDNDLTDNSATDSNPLVPVADLSITKNDGALSSVPGDSISYTIFVSNSGPSSAIGAPVSDSMPAALTGVTWTCVAAAGSACGASSGSGDIATTVDLPPSGSATFTVDATIAPTASGGLSNTAVIDLPAGVTDPDDADRTATDTNTLVPTADLSITKTDGLTDAAPLDAVSYTIVVANAGPSAAIDAVVTDALPGELTGATWTCTNGAGGTCDAASGSGDINTTVDLAPSGTVTLTVNATIASSAVGTVSNTASVAPPTGVTDPAPGDNDATDATAITPTADLSITKTDGQTEAVPGETLTYTIVVSNAGPSDVVNLDIDDTMPATLDGVTWTCLAAGGANCDAATGTGDIATTVDLPSGGSATFTVAATLDPAATGTLSNTAALTPPVGLDDATTADHSATDVDTITPEADLTISKTHGALDAAPGESITYTIVVGNDGPSAAPDAVVDDTMPAELTGVTWTCAAAAGANCDDASGSGDIATTVDLPVGGTATFTVTGTIDPAATGTLTNTAGVSVPTGVTETDVSDNTATDTNPLTPTADLSITKTDGAASSVAGATVTYTIVATNSGPSTIAGATVTDAPPATLTGVTWTCTPSAGSTCTASGTGVIADTVTIAAGGNVTYTLDATVAASATGSLTNAASVSLPVGSTDPTPGNNGDDDTNTITGEADLVITKDDGSATAVPGGSTTYDIVVTNPTGPSDVVGATVTDVLPTDATAMSWTCTASAGGGCGASGSGPISEPVDIPVGGSVTFSVTVDIDAAATGTFTNTAGVAAPVGVVDPVPGNDSATDVDTLTPSADIVVTNTDGVTNATPGTTTTYTVVVANNGPSDAPGTSVSFPVPTVGTITGWTCADDGTSTCTDASGSGAITTTADLPAGTSVTYTVTVAIDETATGTIETTATGTPATGITDPTPANNSATDIDALTLEADLAITKTDGAATSVPGQTVTYTIVVTNDGPSAVTGAPVGDVLPASLVSASWSCSASAGSACAAASGAGDIATSVDLLSGGSATFMLDATIDPDATGTVTNTATVDLPAGVTDPDNADRTATDTNSLLPEADLSISKTDGATAVAPLQATSYTIVVTNSGPSTAVDALVSDTIPAQLTGATWTCTDGSGGTCDTASGSGDISATVDLAPSGSVTFTVDATVSAAATGTVTNTATVTAPAGTTDPDTGNNDATDTSVVAPVADLSITKTDGVTSASSGDTITYTIVVGNAGPSDVVDARIQDAIPATLTGVSWTCAAGANAACDATSGTGSIDELIDLDSATSVTYTVTATVAAVNGTVTNTASITAPSGTTDPDASNNAATDTTDVDPVGNLSITKTDGQAAVIPGTSTSYTIVVANEGPSDVTSVTVDDPLPAELIAASWTCSPSLGATCTDPTGTGDIATTVDLDAGATATFTVAATVAPGAIGTISNTATVAGPANYTDNDPTDDSATDTTDTTPIADLAITKSNGVTRSVPGSPVTYTIVVTNAGPSTATDALVADTLPAELSNATWTCSATAGSACSGVTGTGSLNELVTIEPSGTVTFVVTADLDPAATGQLSNTASVAPPAGTTDPDLGDNDATDTDDLTPEVDLAISKTDGVTSITPGTSTTYTVVVTNAGPSDVVGATVVDTLPAGLTAVTWTCASSLGAACPGAGTGDINTPVDLPVGGTVTFTIDATVTAGATGILSNTATVSAPSGVTDTDASNDSATDDSTLSPVADLSITKSDGATTSVPGTSISYTVIASNTGPSDVLGAEVADRLPAELLNGTWTCAAASGASCGAASGAGSNVNVVVDVPVGGTVTLVVTADIDPGASGLLVNSAAISTPTGVVDADPIDNSATDTNSLDPTADLSITKTDALTDALPGDTVTYTIVVGNAGPSSVVGAPVADTIPPELENVSWTCSATGGSACNDAAGTGDIASAVDLAVGGSATYTITAQVVSTVTGTVANSTTVSAPPGVTDPDPGNNAASDSTTISPLADVSITKTDGVSTIPAGVATTYSIVVTNPGPSALAGVRVVDPLPPALTGATWTCVATGGATCAANGSGDIDELLDMPAGSTATFTITATVDPGSSGTITNTATVELPTGAVDPTPTNNTATDDTIVEGVADLAVTKTDGATSSVPGTPIVYDLVVTNAGPSDAFAASVTDTMPVNLANARWTCTSAGGATCLTTTGVGDVNADVDVPVGGTVTITVTADISPGATGQLSNTAVVSPALGTSDPSLGDNTATDVNALTPDVDLGITIDDGRLDVAPGTTTTYTITVTNAGPSSATGAPVTAVFPPELTNVTWTSDGPTPSGTGDISDAVDLSVGGVVTYTVVATIDPAARGSVIVSATVSAPVGTTETDPTDNADDDVDTLTPTADVSIVKTNGLDDVEPGEIVTYTITVTNAGPSTVDGASVTDVVPAVLTSVTWSCAATSGSACGDVVGTGSIASTVDLAVDGAATFSLTATVSDAAAGTIVNTASVAVPGDTTDPNSDDNTSVDTDVVTPVFDLTITKVADASLVETGDTLGYTIVVSNTGPSAAVGVVVEDRLPSGLAADSWTCVASTGATCAATSGTGVPVVSVDIPAGAEITIRLLTTVTSDPTVDTDLVNIAVATAGAGGTSVVTTEASATVTVDAPVPDTPGPPAPTPTPNPNTDIPRTGSESQPLLLFGFVTLLLGLVLFATSRFRRPAH